MDTKQRLECIRRYHQRTKHHLDRYAKGPDTLDWSMQPNPFRSYAGTTKINLPFSHHGPRLFYGDLYKNKSITAEKPSLQTIGTLFELSLGLSAWKEYRGERWALRCNPSSGNLHPTEAYAITRGLPQLQSGVYHYASQDHGLDPRCSFEKNGAATQTDEPVLIIGFTSVLWREAWKYGERAYRYCQLDVGHALAAVRYACALLGWKAELLTGADDQTMRQLLGIDRDEDFGPAEREHPDLLLHIVTNSTSADIDIEQFVELSKRGKWSGTATVLDNRHLYQWPIIEEVARAPAALNTAPVRPWKPGAIDPPLPCDTRLQAKQIILRRRSAQSFDGRTAMSCGDFYRMLDVLIPRNQVPPWDVLLWKPNIHLVLFVHRVNGLQPGLYIFLRNDQVPEPLKQAFTGKLEWLRIDGTPRHIMLYRLVRADARNAAATLSCHQRIASDSAFSLGMLGEFDAALESGPWSYKHLFWEAGMLGQALYLEAETLNLQGTGIGCFFDDAFHEMLGIKDTQYQSVYHFTVGGALNDGRLKTIKPYDHLKQG